MTRNNPDLIKCGGRTGPEIALLCEGCEGKCPICGAPANEENGILAHLCGDCAFGKLKERCIVCSAPAKYKAYFCPDCVLLGRDRDGCPRIVNVGISRSDKFYERKRVIVIPDQV